MPLSLTEAATALRDKEMTSVELTTAALSRADAVDDRLGVYRSRFDARAMDAAGRADTDFTTGRDRGVLQGIPVGIEDIPAAPDGAMVGPNPVLDPAWLAEREAPVVARIRRSGAVITGRLSSSGTGVGVAAGLFLAGIGPDNDRSIRIPAASCGISGLVPTSGRVPVGVSRNHVADVTRSARDCAAVLGVIAPHHQVLVGGGGSATGEYLGTLCGSLAGVHLGVDRAHDADDFDPAAAGLVDDAVAVLGNLGADVVEVTLTSRAFAQVDGIVGASRKAQVHDYDERPVLILPMGYGSRGRPLSLQITGRPFDEATVLRIGDAYQQITDWHRQVPDPAGV